MLSKIRIVLVNTSHPGNIGAAARAMKNMCLSRLVLVSPSKYPEQAEVAYARASGAYDLLSEATRVDSLDEAVAGCRLIIGSSARSRTIGWPMLTPRECAARAVDAAREADVALVFGAERTGLTNAELDRCHHLVQIPTNPDYSSLNVAMAVQVLAYEVLVASGQQIVNTNRGRLPAAAEQFDGFMQHLEQALDDIGFSDPRRSDKLLRRLRRLFLRAQPDPDELNLLRGILSAAQGRKSMR
ncbi:MAG: tRNA (cytosine(32)/uridine(32)-2'-O)-methyltransferase TrmJ [Pseudomonadota bacterium]